MDKLTVEQKVRQVLDDVADLQIDGEDCSFALTVISADFAGRMVVKRQQLVLSAFAEELGNGSLHALSVKAYTPQEWEQFSAGTTGLTQITL